MTYYGVIQETWEVDYTMFIIPLLKCKWVDNKSGVKMDESGKTLVDFRKVGYQDEPFIMAQKTSQVFYVKDPTSECWFVALQGKKQFDPNEENLSDFNIVVTHPFRRTINVDEIPLVGDVQAIQEDHNEGIYI